MHGYLDNLWSALTTYGLAVVGMVSADNIMFILGALLLVVRLMYEGIRLYRYMHRTEDCDE